MALMDYLNITPAVVSQANKVVGVPPPPSPASNDKVALSDFEKAKPQETPQSAEIDYVDQIQKKGVFGFFNEYNKKPDFDGEEKRTRRARELALLGDIANLGVQTFAASKGARQFTPINSQVPHYNERLQRLRDAKMDYDADLNNKSLSMIVRDYDQRREDEWRDKQLRNAAERDTYNADRDKAHDDYRKETLGETKRHNEAMEKTSMTRALRPVAGGSGKKAVKPVAPKEEYVNVYDDDGSLKRVPARLVTVNDYLKYAKNSLVRDGRLKSTASDHDLYKVMKDRSVYSNPMLKELNSKVGGRLFPRNKTNAEQGLNSPLSGQQGYNETGSLLPK